MNLKEKYFKALKDFAMSINKCKKEDLFKIISEDTCILLKDNSKWHWNYGNKDIELMPENFNPNNINNEIQYEIC